MSVSSASSEITIPFYLSFEKEEMEEFNSSIHEYCQEYIEANIQKMSQTEFHNEMVNEIAHILFQNFKDAEICNECDYAHLFDFIEDRCYNYFEENKLPHRNNAHILENAHCAMYEIPEDIMIDMLEDKINHLRNVNQANPAQRTPEWYQYRYNMITASNLWQALSSEAQQNRLIYEKCKPMDFEQPVSSWINTGSSLHWGVKYEPLTGIVYEKITGAKIEEFGCIQHPKYSFIGASPDGIITNKESKLYGRMVEIKNIYNREMNGIPSEAYWIQMQIQMECCDLEVCDFVETRFKEYENAECFWEEHDETLTRGIILHFIVKDGTSNIPVYKYMPLSINLIKEEVEDWINIVKSEMAEKSYAVFQTIYWYLDEIAMTTIYRNTEWFEVVIPQIETIWRTIETERVSGYQHRAPVKKKGQSNDIIVIDTNNGSDVHIVQNMPSNHGNICLIKLDS